MNSMPKNEYYIQIEKAKARFEKLRQDIEHKQNQLRLAFRNVEDYPTIYSLIGAFYDRFDENISHFQLNNMDIFKNPDRALLEIKRIIGHLSNTERDIVHALELFDSKLSEEYNPQKYSHYKRLIDAFKKLTYDTPLEIVEQIFECEVWRPKHGELIEEGTMDIVGYESFNVIEDLKELKTKKLGEYVEYCTAYGAKNKAGEIMIPPLVTANIVELADKYKNFTIIK